MYSQTKSYIVICSQLHDDIQKIKVIAKGYQTFRKSGQWD